MKNLFKSASAKNLAKFVWEVGSTDSNEAVASQTTKLDYSDVSDLDGKYQAPTNLQQDPDVDEDFMAGIENQEKEPPYAADAKEIISIIKSQGGEVVLNNNEQGEITYTYAELFNDQTAIFMVYQEEKYIIYFEEGSSGETKISGGRYIGKDGDSFASQIEEGFNQNIKGLLSDLKKHVNQKDEPKRTTGLIFDDEAYDETPLVGDRGFKGIKDILDSSGTIQYVGGKGNTVTIENNSLGGFEAKAVNKNGESAGYVETRMVNGKITTFNEKGEEDQSLRGMVDIILNEVKKYH